MGKRSRVIAIAVALAPLAGIFIETAASAQARAPGIVEVRGLRLGMTPDEARAAFRASGLPMPTGPGDGLSPTGIRTDRPSGAGGQPFLSVMSSGTDDRNEALMAFFTPHAGRERVWGIGSWRDYQPGARPPLADVVRMLVGRFGPPASANEAGGRSVGHMYWHWNDAGAVHPNASSVCTETMFHVVENIRRNPVTARNSAASAATVFDRGRRAGCATVIHARIETDRAGGVAALFIGAIDYRAARGGR